MCDQKKGCKSLKHIFYFFLPYNYFAQIKIERLFIFLFKLCHMKAMGVNLMTNMYTVGEDYNDEIRIGRIFIISINFEEDEWANRGFDKNKVPNLLWPGSNHWHRQNTKEN